VEAKQRVLVVDDEPKISEMVRDYLEAVGFEVDSAGDGKTALSKLEPFAPDLLVLDVMMPGLDGLDVIRKIRTESNIPVILLTARATEQDKLIGLELGADDYITKPFSMKELAARIRAVLRRSRPHSTPENLIQHGPISLNFDKRTLSRGGQRIELTGVQFDMLARMMQYPGKVFSRMQLLETVQEQAFEGYERTVDVHIKNIRKALEPNPGNPKYILTVWGVGYKLAEEAELT
jgi:DNA-binding response OmpR family regulator